MRSVDDMPMLPCPNCGKENLVRHSEEDEGWCNNICFKNYQHAHRDISEKYKP